MTAIRELLTRYRDASKTEREKGTYFERLCVEFLKSDPEMAQEFDDAVTHTAAAMDVDNAPGSDAGTSGAEGPAVKRPKVLTEKFRENAEERARAQARLEEEEREFLAEAVGLRAAMTAPAVPFEVVAREVPRGQPLSDTGLACLVEGAPLSLTQLVEHIRSAAGGE